MIVRRDCYCTDMPQIRKLRGIIQSVNHRGLRRFIEDGNLQSIDASLRIRVQNILNALSQSENVYEFIDRAPQSWRVHRLTGNRRYVWSVSVSGNWRLTFEESGNHIYRLNLEDYH